MQSAIWNRGDVGERVANRDASRSRNPRPAARHVVVGACVGLAVVGRLDDRARCYIGGERHRDRAGCDVEIEAVGRAARERIDAADLAVERRDLEIDNVFTERPFIIEADAVSKRRRSCLGLDPLPHLCATYGLPSHGASMNPPIWVGVGGARLYLAVDRSEMPRPSGT